MVAFIVAVCQYGPWLIVAAVAGYMLYKRKESNGLKLQAAGAAALFGVGMAQWLVVDVVLEHFTQTAWVITSGRAIFGFLLFVSLMTFVAGYCLERFAKSKAAVVTASPA